MLFAYYVKKILGAVIRLYFLVFYVDFKKYESNFAENNF